MRPNSLHLTLGLIAGTLLLATRPLAADPVLDWHTLMLDAIRSDNSGPTLSTRNLAILGLAQADAVNSIQPTFQPYALYVPAPDGAHADIAAAAAGHFVLTQLYPSFRARADQLLATFLDRIPQGLERDASLLFGTEIAMEAVSARDADGANTSVPYIPSDLPGQWRRTPPLYRPPLTPHWRYVTPFGIPDATRFRALPPPALDSPEYAAAINEVRSLGALDSTSRTAEQTEIARFWSDFSYTAMPPGHFHEIAIAISQARGLSLAQNARLFGLLGMAQADAAIVCWETKFHYNLWRPVTAIQRATEDGNPDTEADPAWEPLLAAPPFPEYSSGHSTFSKTAATILAAVLGTDQITFTARSDTLPGVFRQFTSLSACADEVGMSRIYGGIHFMFGNLAGKQCGEAIGRYIAQNYLLPLEALPRLVCDVTPQGRVRMLLHGWPGSRYTVQATSDFITWTGVHELEAKPGGAEFPVGPNLPDDPPARFFRAAELEADTGQP